MAKFLTARIEIGNFVFNRVNNVSISSGWEDLTDICSLKLPNLQNVLREGINYGDVVNVFLGYGNENNLEFTGFVESIAPDFPFELRCEDGMYELKKATAISKVFAEITLKELIAEIVPNAIISDSIPDVIIKNFTVSKATPAQVLRKLKEEYFLTAYFRNKILFVGLPYTETGLEPSRADYNLQRNVEPKTNLTFRRAEDVILQVRAISILEDNTRIEVTVGDSDGQVITLHSRNIDSFQALTDWANVELEQFKYEGYKGNFTGFGQPFIIHSATANILDNIYPERAGNYVINKVNTTFGTGGFRRKISLGKRV